MKIVYLSVLMCVIFFSSACSTEQESSDSLVKPMQELKVEALNFDHLPKESQVGNLSDAVKEEECLLDALVERVKKKKSKVILQPHAETLAYVNGQLCHIGNYSQSVIYTVLEGPYYGTQTTMTYGGIVLYVNYDYALEQTIRGAILHHYYSDSEVITGSNQVIKFY